MQAIGQPVALSSASLCPLEGARNSLLERGGPAEPAMQPLSHATPARCGLEGASEPQCRGPGVSGIQLNPLIQLLF